jgi:hypothetical protein
MYRLINPVFVPAPSLQAPERIHAEGELGDWAGAAPAQLQPSIERQTVEYQFCGNEGPVIDVVTKGTGIIKTAKLHGMGVGTLESVKMEA